MTDKIARGFCCLFPRDSLTMLSRLAVNSVLCSLGSRELAVLLPLSPVPHPAGWRITDCYMAVAVPAPERKGFPTHAQSSSAAGAGSDAPQQDWAHLQYSWPPQGTQGPIPKGPEMPQAAVSRARSTSPLPHRKSGVKGHNLCPLQEPGHCSPSPRPRPPPNPKSGLWG